MSGKSHGCRGTGRLSVREEVIVMKGPSGSAADNEDKLTGLFKELSPRLRSMVERRMPPGLGRRIGAEDILQGAFVRLRESVSSDGPGSDEELSACIFRAVLNEWHDQRRRNKAACRNFSAEEPFPDGSVVMLLKGMGVSTNCGLKETTERIREAVKPEVFEIVWMHAVDGFTHKEIAVIVGKAENTVGRCYLRALEKIRKVVSSPFTSS